MVTVQDKKKKKDDAVLESIALNFIGKRRHVF